MSISVKNSNANELAESMSEILSNEEFTSMFKKAEDLGAEFDPFATAKPTQTTGADFIGNVPVMGKDSKVIASLPVNKPMFGPQSLLPTDFDLFQIALKSNGYKKSLTDFGKDTVAQKTAIDYWLKTQHKADDQAAEDHEECHEEKHKDHEDKQECDAIERGSVAADDNVVAAVDFAITHLTKIAAALDNNGFAGLANIIDETIKRVAAKK